MAYGNQGWRLATISYLDYDDTQIYDTLTISTRLMDHLPSYANG